MPYLPETSHVTLLASLRRERLLPMAGTITVQTRQRVEAGDVVGRTVLAEGHRLVDVARQLGVPAEKADGAMLKTSGDPVKANEPLAQRKTALGLMKRSARSPVEGRLVAAAGGKALVAAISKPFELRAGIPGNVVTILQARGVVIETTGALLEGAWGNGGEDFAPLRLAGKARDAKLTAELVSVEMRGALVAAGVLDDPAVLKKLAGLPVRGLIVGTLASALLPAAQKLDIPVLVVEGFGARGFSDPAYALLQGGAGREAWLNAKPADRFSGHRPELIIPLASPSTAPPPPGEGKSLAAGQRVRVVRGLAAGQVGTVADLSERPLATASGVRAYVASVLLDGSEAEAQVPYANVELLE
jgi:hypothetical protein